MRAAPHRGLLCNGKVTLASRAGETNEQRRQGDANAIAPLPAALLREYKGELELHQPRLLAGLGSDGVVVAVQVDPHSVSVQPEQLAKAAANRDGPFSAARYPVRRDFRRRADRPAIAEMIVDDGIEEELVGPVTACGWAAKGPDIVDDGAEVPRALILVQKCYRRTRAPFVDAERRIRRRWIIEDRPRPPIE